MYMWLPVVLVQLLILFYMNFKLIFVFKSYKPLRYTMKGFLYIHKISPPPKRFHTHSETFPIRNKRFPIIQKIPIASQTHFVLKLEELFAQIRNIIEIIMQQISSILLEIIYRVGLKIHICDAILNALLWFCHSLQKWNHRWNHTHLNGVIYDPKNQPPSTCCFQKIKKNSGFTLLI